MLVSALRTPLASTLSPNTGLGLVVFYWGAFRSPLFQNLGCRSRKPAASCTPLEQGPPCASDPVAAAEGRPSRPDQQGGRLLAGQALTNAMRTRVPSACLHTDLCSESTRFHTWLWEIRQAEPRSLPQRFAPPGRWPQSWQSPNAHRHPHCTAPHSLSHTVAPPPRLTDPRSHGSALVSAVVSFPECCAQVGSVQTPVAPGSAEEQRLSPAWSLGLAFPLTQPESLHVRLGCPLRQ